jgi:VanZ family protein
MKQLLHKIVQYKRLLLGLSLAWLAFLAVLSLIPYDGTELLPETGSDFRWDYIEHFAGYLVLGGLFALWRLNRDFTLPLWEIFLILAAGFIISFGLEYAQVFIPGRSFNVIDVIYNIIGLAAGIIVSWIIIGKLILYSPVRSE